MSTFIADIQTASTALNFLVTSSSLQSEPPNPTSASGPSMAHPFPRRLLLPTRTHSHPLQNVSLDTQRLSMPFRSHRPLPNLTPLLQTLLQMRHPRESSSPALPTNQFVSGPWKLGLALSHTKVMTRLSGTSAGDHSDTTSSLPVTIALHDCGQATTSHP